MYQVGHHLLQPTSKRLVQMNLRDMKVRFFHRPDHSLKAVRSINFQELRWVIRNSEDGVPAT